MENDNFKAAQAMSASYKQYKLKKMQNDTKKAFVDEYYRANGELTDELRERIREYKLAQRGIFFNNYPDLKVEVAPEDMYRVFLEIKNMSQSNFERFYRSYVDKIEKGYGEDKIANAFDDLKVAYHTYRRCFYPDWKCPHEFITESEMKNLYKLFNPEEAQKQSNIIELDITKK